MPHYQEPAPRYSRPVPASRLPGLPLARRAPRSGAHWTRRPSVWFRNALDAFGRAWERERDDKMLRIGIGIGGFAAIAGGLACRALL